MALSIPRDRAGTFDPKLIAKYQRRFPDFDDKIISMYSSCFPAGKFSSSLLKAGYQEVFSGTWSPSISILPRMDCALTALSPRVGNAFRWIQARRSLILFSRLSRRGCSNGACAHAAKSPLNQTLRITNHS